MAADDLCLFDLSRLANRSILRLVALILSGGLIFLGLTLWRSIRGEGKRLVQQSLFRPKELRSKQAKVGIEETKKGGRWQLFIDDGKKRILLNRLSSESKAQAMADRVRKTLGCS